MEFCPECGSVLKIKKKDKKVFWECRKCGYRRPYDTKELKRNYKSEVKKDAIVVEKNVYERKGLVTHKCPFCGYDKAYLIFEGVLWGDEDTIEIYQCAKCGKRSREGLLY